MSANAAYADWIAVDWGTSNLRCWAMREGEDVGEATSTKGMSGLAHSALEPAFVA
ncbi:MAG: 2-dehydro-3-deoxygalactonokinase, partial [Boseongicola sp.]|nr:2-dehydro-3-deoxygalactonokinase [Boseongicola sp.]